MSIGCGSTAESANHISALQRGARPERDRNDHLVDPVGLPRLITERPEQVTRARVLPTALAHAYADPMARYVIDAPTLLHIVARDLGIDPAHQLVAAKSILSEAMQLLLWDVRADERTATEALEIHERITGMKMRLLGDRASRGLAWRIAMEQGWDSLREAEYIAITHLQADALVTVDEGLAAKAENVVPVAQFGALLTSE